MANRRPNRSSISAFHCSRTEGGAATTMVLAFLRSKRLARDQARLDGLAEPGVVRDEEIDARQPKGLAQRFHLVGVDPDPGPERRLEEIRVKWRSPSSSAACAGTPRIVAAGRNRGRRGRPTPRAPGCSGRSRSSRRPRSSAPARRRRRRPASPAPTGPAPAAEPPLPPANGASAPGPARPARGDAREETAGRTSRSCASDDERRQQGGYRHRTSQGSTPLHAAARRAEKLLRISGCREDRWVTWPRPLNRPGSCWSWSPACRRLLLSFRQTLLIFPGRSTDRLLCRQTKRRDGVVIDASDGAGSVGRPIRIPE